MKAQKITGLDPDFHRRDLWEAIENGNYPECEFGRALIEEADEHRFDFDLLEATKLIPQKDQASKRSPIDGIPDRVGEILLVVEGDVYAHDHKGFRELCQNRSRIAHRT